MKRPRDFQRSRVYEWEQHIFWDQPRLSLLGIEKCAFRMWDDLEHSRGRVLDGRARRSPCAHANGDLAFPRYHRRNWVVAHEVAHTLIPARLAAHGPQFMGCYLELCAKFPSHDTYTPSPRWQRRYDTLIELARKEGLEVAFRWRDDL